MNRIMQSWSDSDINFSFRDFLLGVGSRYMQGEFTANEIQDFINRYHWSQGSTGYHEALKLVRLGTQWAIENDSIHCAEGRVQPEQSQETLDACKGSLVYLRNGECVLSRRIKKFTKSSFLTANGESLKIKDGWQVYSREEVAA